MHIMITLVNKNIFGSLRYCVVFSDAGSVASSSSTGHTCLTWGLVLLDTLCSDLILSTRDPLFYIKTHDQMVTSILKGRRSKSTFTNFVKEIK